MYLTTQEKKTVVFVLALLILGIGLDFLYKYSQRDDFINCQALQEKLSKKSDINRARLSELSAIPALNEQLAKAIIAYRNLNGDFRSIEDLKNIKGIKDKKLEQLKKYITIESPSD
jgi:competence protein ComEA